MIAEKNTEDIKGQGAILSFKNNDYQFNLNNFGQQFVAFNKRILVKIMLPIDRRVVNTNIIFLDTEDKSMGEKRFGVGQVLESASEQIKKGDIIMFNKWAGMEIRANQELYSVIKEEDVCGTFKEAN